MNTYDIIITPDAERDLKLIKKYIADSLMMPDTAADYIHEIRDKMKSLSEMPGRIKLIDKEPWHSRGIRNLPVKNFIIYFRIEESKNTVFILNVIYNKRDMLQ